MTRWTIHKPPDKKPRPLSAQVVGRSVEPSIHGASTAISSKTAPDIASKTRNTLDIAQFSQAHLLP